jgi:pyridoxine 5-phosphate synthase
MQRVRLHVNVDHVATLRQARGTVYPDPVDAAALCESAGAVGITVHLREDRRHIQDRDVEVLRRTVKTFLNLEMATTDAMVALALRVKPDLVTLVPEKREERTTEGGLDVVGLNASVARAVEMLAAGGIPTSLFIDPEEAQIDASAAVGANAIELHTGDYANASDPSHELERLARAAAYSVRVAPKMRVAAGHGLHTRNVVALLARCPEIEELNVGHAIVSDAVLVGMGAAVKQFLAAMAEGERAA